MCNIRKRLLCVSCFTPPPPLPYRANVYEEEDFQHSSFDYNLSEEVTETKAMNMLKAAEEELIKKTKDTEDEREREELQALLARVRFTRLLLHSLVGMYPLKVIVCRKEVMAELVTNPLIVLRFTARQLAVWAGSCSGRPWKSV